MLKTLKITLLVCLTLGTGSAFAQDKANPFKSGGVSSRPAVPTSSYPRPQAGPTSYQNRYGNRAGLPPPLPTFNGQPGQNVAGGGTTGDASKTKQVGTLNGKPIFRDEDNKYTFEETAPITGVSGVMPGAPF